MPQPWLDEDEILAQLDFSSGLSQMEMTPPPDPTSFQIREHDEEHTRFETACANGDLAVVKQFYPEHHHNEVASVESWLQSSDSSLICAFAHQQHEVAANLLSKGLPFNSSHAKVTVEKVDKVLLEVLLSHGWQINDRMNWTFPSALALAVEDEDLVVWFLLHGADPNADCYFDMTPVSLAVVSASFTTIKVLFDHGASIHRGQLLIHAVHRILPDWPAVIAYLLELGADINEVMYERRRGNYLMHEALGLGTPLHNAIDTARLEVVEMLVGLGSDLRILDSLGRTALEACEKVRGY